MRSFLLALFAGTAIVSASGIECAQNNLSELVSRTTCGCSKSITACLGRGVDLESLEEIEQCFVGGGCSGVNAAVEAVMFAQECHRERGADDREDLRKRQATNTKTTNAKTTGENAKTATSAEATTTSDASSTSAAPSSTTSADSTTTDGTTSTDSTTTTSAASAITSGAESCYVTSIKSTSACSVHAGTTVTCIPTTTAIQSCAPGMLCFSPTAGANSCMTKQDKLTTSGLIVAIIFAGGIGAALIAWAILCLRSRNRNKRQEQLRRMMASSGKGQDVESISQFATRPATRKRAMGSEANLPLITPGGTRSDQTTYAQQDGYFEHGPTGNAPPPVPKIHPGAEALGQENRI